MSCSRCGNKKWNELFPYCNKCDICVECDGSGHVPFSAVRCVICLGKGYTVKKEVTNNAH